ncbi:MAG TPA: PLP-dependent aminotransferase family protein [Steroidobacteraceae bacterium]|nr:PLP-dependent aminotransferase family protein [Steroidobacteraceae bacterium]
MWTPDLPTDGTPLFQQILAALERSIRDGGLKPGERLPPQRELAKALGVSVGTVTKAYEEADRRGLTLGHVGRGTYIANVQDGPQSQAQVVDMSMNHPPMVAAERLLMEAWGKVRRSPEFAKTLNYGPVEGLPTFRRFAAHWLNRTAGVEEADASRMLIVAGAQASMDLVFSTLCKPGDVILTEELTFSGMKAIARYRGFSLSPVAMDDEGVIPDSLEKAVRMTGSRVFYTMPTLQNPTARTLSLARRKELVKVARRLQVTLVEDDVYGAYVDRRDAPPALVNLAPDITYYLSGLSKSLAPGLRTGFIIAPTAVLASHVAVGLRAASYSGHSLGLLIARQVVEDGSADQILKENRKLLRNRRGALCAVLNLKPDRVAAMSPHVWLPTTEPEAARLAARLLEENVRVTDISDPVLDSARGSGLRFCLGTVRRDADFERALSAIQRIMQQPPDLALRAAV